MERPGRREVGYALLFSVPPGVGATVFTARVEGGPPWLPAFGVAFGVGLFVALLAVFTTGEPNR